MGKIKKKETNGNLTCKTTLLAKSKPVHQHKNKKISSNMWKNSKNF